MFENLRVWHHRNDFESFCESYEFEIRYTLFGNIHAKSKTSYFGPESSVYQWVFCYNETIGHEGNAPGEFSHSPLEVKIYLQYKGTVGEIEVGLLENEQSSYSKVYIGTVRFESWNIGYEIQAYMGKLSNIIGKSPEEVREEFNAWQEIYSISLKLGNPNLAIYPDRPEIWFSAKKAYFAQYDGQRDPEQTAWMMSHKKHWDREYDLAWRDWLTRHRV